MARNTNLEEKRQHFPDMKGKEVSVDSEREKFVFRCGAKN